MNYFLLDDFNAANWSIHLTYKRLFFFKLLCKKIDFYRDYAWSPSLAKLQKVTIKCAVIRLENYKF
jgi:hypothetical protein